MNHQFGVVGGIKLMMNITHTRWGYNTNEKEKQPFSSSTSLRDSFVAPVILEIRLEKKKTCAHFRST